MTIPLADRWLEMDLTWFDPDADVLAQIETLLERIAPLLRSVEGSRGLFFNLGWLIGERADIEDFASKNRTAMATDIDGAPVFLGKSTWELGYIAERYPKLAFSRSKERG